MNKPTKTLLLSALLAAAATGPLSAYADTGCADESAASKSTTDHRFAASSPMQWQPGNPFRDDTGA